MKHGSGGYARGCRCDDCRAGHREMARRYYDKSNEWRQKKRAEDPEAARAKDKERYWTKRRPLMLEARRKRVYGMDGDQFAALLVVQGGRCGICRVDTPNGRGAWHIDHDHETGKVRGILCHSCNVALGNFRDSAENLRAALAYLASPPADIAP